MADNNRKLNIWHGIARFLDSPDLADFTIVCGSTKWKVHRFVLSLHSTVLGKAYNGTFLEYKTREIDLSEHDVPHVKAMIDFIYKFDYNTDSEDSRGEELCFHVEMCILSDKYDIQGLKTLSVEKFNAQINDITDGNALACVAALAYKTANATTEMRRSIVLHVAREHHLVTMITKGGFLKTAMKSWPDFPIEITKAMSGEMSTWSVLRDENATFQKLQERIDGFEDLLKREKEAA